MPMTMTGTDINLYWQAQLALAEYLCSVNETREYASRANAAIRALGDNSCFRLGDVTVSGTNIEPHFRWVRGSIDRLHKSRKPVEPTLKVVR